jgi:hypothetical protein
MRGLDTLSLNQAFVRQAGELDSNCWAERRFPYSNRFAGIRNLLPDEHGTCLYGSHLGLNSTDIDCLWTQCLYQCAVVRGGRWHNPATGGDVVRNWHDVFATVVNVTVLLGAKPAFRHSLGDSKIPHFPPHQPVPSAVVPLGLQAAQTWISVLNLFL